MRLRRAERVGPAPQRRQVRGARPGRRIGRRHPVVQGRPGHSRHARGGCPEEPDGELSGPGEPERVRFRDFDLRGAPDARQLDHHDQASIAVGAEDQLPGLAYNRLLGELRHCDPPPAQRRLRGRKEERAEQVPCCRLLARKSRAPRPARRRRTPLTLRRYGRSSDDLIDWRALREPARPRRASGESVPRPVPSRRRCGL